MNICFFVDTLSLFLRSLSSVIMTQCWWWSRHNLLFRAKFDDSILLFLDACLSNYIDIVSSICFFLFVFWDRRARLGVCVLVVAFSRTERNRCEANVRRSKQTVMKNRRKHHAKPFILILLRESIFNGMPFVALHLLRTLWIVSDDCSIASWQFIISRSQRRMRVCLLPVFICAFFYYFVFFSRINCVEDENICSRVDEHYMNDDWRAHGVRQREWGAWTNVPTENIALWARCNYAEKS